MLILCVVILFPQSCKHDHARHRNETGQRISPVSYLKHQSLDQFIQEIKTYYGLVGIAAVVFRSDSYLESAGIGVRRYGQEETITLDDLFHIGSCAETMTTMLAAMLVEEGVLSWDTTLLEVFPDFADTIHPAFQTITFKDIISHKAGIISFQSDLSRILEIVPDIGGSTREQRRKFACWQLQQEPHMKQGMFEYSNTHYSLVGSILEEAMNMPWETLISERLFQPLGLNSAGFGWPADEDIHQPWGHTNQDGIHDVHPSKDYRIPELFAPVGDIHMSIRDFANYGQLHLQGLHGRDRLLNSETFTYLHTPINNQGNRIALGWGIDEYQGAVFSDHESNAGTFFAKIILCHDYDLGCVICTNVGGETAAEACRNVCTELLDKYLPIEQNSQKRKMESVYNKVVEILVFLRQINLRRGVEFIADQLREQVEKLFHKQSPTRETTFTRIY